jgi:hypothetical protein
MILNDFLSADGFFGESYRAMNNPGEDDFMDEQLQIALRISLEEEKKRIEEMEKRKLQDAGVRNDNLKESKIKEESKEPKTDFLEKAEEIALNQTKEGGETAKEDLEFVPDQDFLDDLKKELGIPEEEIIKNQLDNPNKIEEETPKKEEDKDDKIKEESQENELKKE